MVSLKIKDALISGKGFSAGSIQYDYNVFLAKMSFM